MSTPILRRIANTGGITVRLVPARAANSPTTTKCNPAMPAPFHFRCVASTASPVAASRLSFGEPFTVCCTGGHKASPYVARGAGGGMAGWQIAETQTAIAS